MVNFDLSFTRYMTLIRSINIKNKIETISIIGIIKIAFIIFISFTFFTNISPFYKAGDAYVYAITGIALANGSYGYTNELWTETGRIEFVPQHWKETNQEVLVPVSSPGILSTSALSYLIGGYYGLFFVGPILSILFLIVSERVATKLFGSFVGLVALVLLGSDLLIFKVSVQLLSDNIFSIFFVLGVFYLIKYFHEKNHKLILISSIFFVTSAFFRFNGLIFLPIEVLLMITYAFYTVKSNSKINSGRSFIKSLVFSRIKSKQFVKIFVLLILPWMSVFLFYFSYNDYYFGDPLTSYYKVSRGLESEYLFLSFFIFDDNRFDSIKFYSIPLLPDIIGINLLNETNLDARDAEENLLMIFSFFILILAAAISLYDKNKRTEVFVFISFIMGLILFYSSDYAVTIGESERFMIPAISITFILFGYIFQRILQINLGRYSIKETSNISKSFKVSLWIIIGIFLFVSVLEPGIFQVEKIMKNDFNNPEVFASRYPLDSEGLSSESIIVETKGRRAMEYNANPFLPARGGWVNSINELDPSLVPQEPIQILNKVMQEGYEAYTFKEHNLKFDPLYFRFLEAEHGIILKDYSKTFCKMVLVENKLVKDGKDFGSDDVCYMYRGKVLPKN